MKEKKNKQLLDYLELVMKIYMVIWKEDLIIMSEMEEKSNKSILLN
jgi:hypothetical protein